MSFGKFGARPRSMSNPTYWVSRHLQDQRKVAVANVSTAKFNERWHRLNTILGLIGEDFVKPLNGKTVSVKESNRINVCWTDATKSKESIAGNVNTCSATELSKYATSIKKLAMISFELCRKCSVYDDIVDFGYDTSSKTFMLNGVSKYFLG